MAQTGVTGLTRGARPRRTTRPDPAAARPADLVDRHFAAARPNQLRVAGVNLLPDLGRDGLRGVRAGVFARRILGWRAATAMTTPLVLDCLEQAIWTRRCEAPATWRPGAPHRRGVAIYVDRVHQPPGRGRD